jgi:ATP-dependent DNA ligase
VIGAFSLARRCELFAELQALVVDVAEHPWSRAAQMRHAPQGASRWNPNKDLSFVAPRPERVVEARHDYVQGARLRHPPRFVRWRADRDPASCGYAQLEQPTPFDIADILAGRPHHSA